MCRSSVRRNQVFKIYRPFAFGVGAVNDKKGCRGAGAPSDLSVVREFVEAVLWIAHTGSPWRELLGVIQCRLLAIPGHSKR